MMEKGRVVASGDIGDLSSRCVALRTVIATTAASATATAATPTASALALSWLFVARHGALGDFGFFL